jgi:hypothetical protein
LTRAPFAIQRPGTISTKAVKSELGSRGRKEKYYSNACKIM